MRISGVGCCLLDYIYHHYSYENESFRKLLSTAKGDGGIIPGGLVFTEDLARFSGKHTEDLLAELVAGIEADAVNLGGPAIVAMVHAAQLLADQGIEVSFSGVTGTDEAGMMIRDILAKTPVNAGLRPVEGLPTPSSHVLSDPHQHGGKGERTFLNTIGAAGEFTAEDVPEGFYRSDIVLLGGTALVPRLHDNLDTVLRTAHDLGVFTVVGTVFDFRNERRGMKRWPLGSDDAYQSIDLLIADAVEAMRLTGTQEILASAKALQASGVGAFIITNGAKPMLGWSSAYGRIAPFELSYLPVSAFVDELLEEKPAMRKDSTGCGDNFVGGVLVSIALQMQLAPARQVDLLDLCAWGASSGGFACMYHGGTYFETKPMEKLEAIAPIVADYHKRLPASIRRVK